MHHQPHYISKNNLGEGS